MATAAEDDDDRHVLGHAPRSLFDALRPSRVAMSAAHVPGPGGMLPAALQQEAVTGGVDRATDLVVVGGRGFGLLPEAWILIDRPDRVLGVAYGLAAVRWRRGSGTRTWALLPARAMVEGTAVGGVELLATADHVGVVLAISGSPAEGARAAGLLTACGIAVVGADDADPWSVLSALDHGMRSADAQVTAIVATAGEG